MNPEEKASLDARIAALGPGERLVVPMTGSEYHARPEISSGGVRCIRNSGEFSYFHAYVARDLPAEDSDPFRLGRIFHLAMADVHWRQKIFVLPLTLMECEELAVIRKSWLGRTRKSLEVGAEIDKASPAHREYLDLLKANRQFIEWATEDELSLATEQIQAVLDNPATAWLADPNLKHEVCGFYRCPRTGLLLKAMADVWYETIDQSLIADFKTTRFGTRRAFGRWACSREVAIHVQVYHYCEVFGAQEAAVVSVRNFRPCEAMFFSVPHWRMQEAKGIHEAALDLIAECSEMGEWHSAGYAERNQLVEETDFAAAM